MKLLIILLTVFSGSEPVEKKPIGMVKVSDNLYVLRREVTKGEWAEYIYYNKNVPVTEQERMEADFPQTDISYEQAIAYCNWLSDLYNTEYYRKSKRKIVFRLPSRSEFELTIRKEFNQLEKYGSEMAYQIEDTNGELIPVRVYNFQRKRVMGLFHNVSEMSAEKGVALGMNNTNFDINGDPLVEIAYEGPSKWVGFRYVAEFVDKD